MRFRTTIRGEGVEIRGYATMEALAALAAPPGEQPYVIAVSGADDDYDPFKEAELRELHHFETEQENERLKAMIERIKAARSNGPECVIHPGDDEIICGWKMIVRDIDKVLGQ